MKFTIIFNDGKASEILEDVERFVLDDNDVSVHLKDGSTKYLENVLLIDVSV